MKSYIPKPPRQLSEKISRRKIATPVLIVALLICCAALAFAVSAYNWRTIESSLSGKASVTLSSTQTSSGLQGQMNAKLSFQPQADRFRRRIGQRFLKQGREEATLTGTLTIGNDNHTVNITRQRGDDGESISISLDGQTASLTWNGTEGAKSASIPATGEMRSLIERIALDSPDQFILAQLRGASYRTVAQRVVPQGAAEIEDYTGPSWDVVRVGEPDTTGEAKPQSAWRLYYLNYDTGLIERIASEENGQTIVAEMSEWTEQGGELFPTRIVWLVGGQKAMELVLDSVAFVARQ